MVSILEKVAEQQGEIAEQQEIQRKIAEQQGEILSLPSSSNLKRTAADDGTTPQPQKQKQTKVTSSVTLTHMLLVLIASRMFRRWAVRIGMWFPRTSGV